MWAHCLCFLCAVEHVPLTMSSLGTPFGLRHWQRFLSLWLGLALPELGNVLFIGRVGYYFVQKSQFLKVEVSQESLQKLKP